MVWLAAGAIFLVVYFILRKKLSHHALFSFKYENFLKSILIPILSSFIVLSLFRFISGIPLMEGRITSWFGWVSFLITGPFFEELFLRGLVLGGSFYLSSKLRNKYASYFFIALGFLLQLFVFVWIHGYSETVRVLYLVIIGLLYSALFLFSKREVLPAMIAHAVTNLIIILGVFA